MIVRFNDRGGSSPTASGSAAGSSDIAGVRAQWPGIPQRPRRRPPARPLGRCTTASSPPAATCGPSWRSSRWRRSSGSSGRSSSSGSRRGTRCSTGPHDTKLATLADPAWRDRARTDWDSRTRSSLSRIDRPHEMILADLGDRRRPDRDLARRVRRRTRAPHLRRAGRVGARQRHPLDRWSAPGAAQRDRRRAGAACAGRCANINDSGADLQLFAGRREHIYLLTALRP